MSERFTPEEAQTMTKRLVSDAGLVKAGGGFSETGVFEVDQEARDKIRLGRELERVALTLDAAKKSLGESFNEIHALTYERGGESGLTPGNKADIDYAIHVREKLGELLDLIEKMNLVRS